MLFRSFYGYVGGPFPTDLAGNPVAINNAGTFLSVDFMTQTIGAGVSVILNPTTIISGLASGTIQDFITPNVGIISAPTDPIFLYTTGFFVGPTAAGAITSFDIRDTNAGLGATGTAVFDRSAPPPQ